MFHTKVQARNETSARAALRRATDASHQRMHGLEPFAQIAAGTLPISQYRLLLQSLFLFHSAVGRVARRAGWARLSSAERRLDLLRSDLSFLGGAVPVPVHDWQAGTGEAVLGALYAAEGSMLGGRVIARQLDYAFGSRQEGRRFFIGDKRDRGNWSRLMEVLEARCAHPSTLDAAISGAIRTFDWFEQRVTCTSQLISVTPSAALRPRSGSKCFGRTGCGAGKRFARAMPPSTSGDRPKTSF